MGVSLHDLDQVTRACGDLSQRKGRGAAVPCKGRGER